jgi:hypothetical protein
VSSLKPKTKKAIQEAREELQHADMGAFDRAMQVLLKVTEKKPSSRKARIRSR